MKLISISEPDIAAAIARLQAGKGTCADIEAAAAWAVANYDRVQKLRSHMAGLLWGAEAETLDVILDEAMNAT